MLLLSVRYCSASGRFVSVGSYLCIFQTTLEIVLPRYLEYLKIETNKKDNPPAARAEINLINNIGSSMRALITSCDFFSRYVRVGKVSLCHQMLQFCFNCYLFSKGPRRWMQKLFFSFLSRAESNHFHVVTRMEPYRSRSIASKNKKKRDQVPTSSQQFCVCFFYFYHFGYLKSIVIFA